MSEAGVQTFYTEWVTEEYGYHVLAGTTFGGVEWVPSVDIFTHSEDLVQTLLTKHYTERELLVTFNEAKEPRFTDLGGNRLPEHTETT